MMRVVLVFIMFCLFSFQSKADDPIVNFKAEIFNKSVVLNWEVVQGNTCFGLYIQRSTDGVNFSTIGIIPGICGSTQETIPYSFTDPSPVKNQINYYRINLGNVLPTFSIQIDFIDLSDNNYKIKPNPIVSEAELFFNNTSAEELMIFFFNSSGVFVKEVKTIADSYRIYSSDFDKGVHYFFIYSNSKLQVKGSFLIL